MSTCGWEGEGEGEVVLGCWGRRPGHVNSACLQHDGLCNSSALTSQSSRCAEQGPAGGVLPGPACPSQRRHPVRSHGQTACWGGNYRVHRVWMRAPCLAHRIALRDGCRRGKVKRPCCLFIRGGSSHNYIQGGRVSCIVTPTNKTHHKRG